jgi:hypothetical protein
MIIGVRTSLKLEVRIEKTTRRESSKRNTMKTGMYPNAGKCYLASIEKRTDERTDTWQTDIRRKKA